MKEYYTIFVLLISVISFCRCSAISDAVSDITSLDCDEWLQEETVSELNELCRELDGYLDADASSLTANISQALPSATIADSHHVFLQLTNADGDPLQNISADDVTVEVSTDDGETYEDVGSETVELLSEADDLMASIGMVIDYSGSILDEDLEDVNSGLAVFYDNIITDTVSTAYQSAVIKFSTDVDVIQDLTSTKQELLDAVADTDYDRDLTSLYDAIVEAADLVSGASSDLNLLVVFTDGLDNDSAHTEDTTIAYAQELNVPVCMVGVSFADVDMLTNIAEETGCFFVYKTVFTSLDAAFETFADQINGFYVITLPESFDETSGRLKITVDAGEDEAREIYQTF